VTNGFRVSGLALLVLLAALSEFGGTAIASAAASAVPEGAAPVEFFGQVPRVEGSVELDALLGFPAGERAATFEEIGRCLESWARTSDRVRLVEHGRTWEGRPLRHLVVSSPENLARLEEIRSGWNRVADPRSLTSAEAESLAGTLPAVAWLAFSIHGDEVSPADAALVLADRLVASRDTEVDALLRDLVVIFDPIQNPDGRERYLTRVRETTGSQPTRDSQSAQQNGTWPWGRTNHYLFDLNRDWVFATQPETRARIQALSGWRPLFFLDVHEMGIDSSYLFYPPSPPFNPFLPANAVPWWDRFGRDEAAAFDRQGWRYYTGEWADWWFPGYSDSFGTLRGAVGILHEQAGITSGTVRLDNGGLLTYRESVAHQVTAAWANLRTLAANRAEIARDFSRERRRAVAPDGPLEGWTLAVVPDGNRSRLKRFVEAVTRLGGEVERTTSAVTVKANDPFARRTGVRLPAGTLLVRGRQPDGALLRATLDFDLPLPREILARERAALVEGKNTLLYDISGWSLPLLYGLDAYEIDGEVAGGSVRVEPATAVESAPEPAAREGVTGAPVAWVVDGADDGSVRAAVRLLEAGIRVRVADKPFALDGRTFARGSLLVQRDDNRARAGLAEEVRAIAGELALAAHPLATGFGEGELPDLGGEHFILLERPRVALVGHGEADTTTYGALWHALDREIGTPLSLLEGRALDSADLRRYNVLVLAPGIEIGEGRAAKLKAWMEGGGTLIAVGGAADAIARDKLGLTSARRLDDASEGLALYRADLVAEWNDRLAGPRDAAIARALSVSAAAAAGALVSAGEGLAGGGTASKEERERLGQRASRFAPLGVLLAGRIDEAHWLTAGAREMLPLFVAGDPVLLARSPAAAPVRFGVALPSETATARSGGAAKRPLPQAPESGWKPMGWSAIPPGHDLALRLSGLLWPEAGERLANAAYLVREPIGAGQVVLFAGDPVWRGAALGSQRLFANAVVYGPGCGTRTVVVP
jgi:hypothetical protein